MPSYQSLNIPYKKGMDYGMGINTINSQIAGKAVMPSPPQAPNEASGQIVTMDLTLISSYEHLQKTLGISAEVDARYGFFDAEGKFNFASSSNFNSQSTFIVARCVIENPFKNADVAILPEAANLLAQGNEQQFIETFGDGYVRGMSTGGELYILCEISSKDYSEQTSVAASLQAEYNALLVGASVSVSVDYKESLSNGSTKLSYSKYQVGGSGTDIKFEPSAEGIKNALNGFAEVVKNNPVPYYVQVANYKTLLLPNPPNYIDLENKKESLNEAAINHGKLLTIRNDIGFIIQNPDFFDNVPEMKVLNDWLTSFTNQLNQITKQASHCVDDIKQCSFGNVVYPDNWDLYTKIKRKEVVDDSVMVPNVLNQPVQQAVDYIKSIGLVPQSVTRTVDTNDNTGFVIAQLPPEKSVVKKGAVVTITSNVKKIDWNWKHSMVDVKYSPEMLKYRVGIVR